MVGEQSAHGCAPTRPKPSTKVADFKLYLDYTHKGYILEMNNMPLGGILKHLMVRYEGQAAEGCAMNEASTDGRGAQKPCCCHHKATPRSQQMQEDLQKRLNRVIGQLNGVKTMIDDNRYCGDVLVQLSAAESAVHSISAILLQNHLETCVVEQIEQGNTQIIDEAMQLIKKFAR